MIALTQKEDITHEGDNIFRNFLTPSLEVKKLLDLAVERMGLKRFGILYPDNSYGRYLFNLFWDRLEERDASVTAVESYSPETTDYAEQIKKMTGRFYPRPQSVVQEFRGMWTPEQEECEIYPEEPEPIIDFEAVFIPDNFQRVAMITPQLVYHDVLDVLLLGTSLWQSSQLIDLAGDYVQEVVFTSGFFEGVEDPLVKTFVQEYSQVFDGKPGILAATGYDTIRLLERILADGHIRSRKDLRKALQSGVGIKGVTGEIRFDAQGEVLKEPLLITISGKRMIPYSD
jgi:ABC-type branched-subunit amino acid transport system substrate-binding protein